MHFSPYIALLLPAVSVAVISPSERSAPLVEGSIVRAREGRIVESRAALSVGKLQALTIGNIYTNSFSSTPNNLSNTISCE
jgi:hypothetical protein